MKKVFSVIYSIINKTKGDGGILYNVKCKKDSHDSFFVHTINVLVIDHVEAFPNMFICPECRSEVYNKISKIKFKSLVKKFGDGFIERFYDEGSFDCGEIDESASIINLCNIICTNEEFYYDWI